MRKIGLSLPVLALVLLVVPGASRAVHFGSVGLLLVSHTDVRGLPPTATTLRFTGLAEDHTTVLFGPATRDAAPRTALLVPPGIKITVKLKVRTAAGQPFKYNGTVAVAGLGQFAPPLPPAAMPPEVTGSTGAVVFVER